MRTMRTWAWTAGIVLMLAGMTGCVNSGWPYAGFGGAGFGGFFAPIPVPPWVTERMEEKYCYKNDHRTPIMPPIRDGFPPPLCEDPPSEGEVLRAMPHVTRGVPYVYEEFRDQITIIPERIKDVIDPPRFYPLIGPAQLHHCHWKVTIYYYETVEVGYPFPFECKKQRVEVMYIDKDHLHLYANADQKKLQTFTRELSGY
jgi:hypothetical protein